MEFSYFLQKITYLEDARISPSCLYSVFQYYFVAFISVLKSLWIDFEVLYSFDICY